MTDYSNRAAVHQALTEHRIPQHRGDRMHTSANDIVSIDTFRGDESDPATQLVADTAPTLPPEAVRPSGDIDQGHRGGGMPVTGEFRNADAATVRAELERLATAARQPTSIRYSS